MKKVLAMALCLCMVLGVFAGCGKKADQVRMVKEQDIYSAINAALDKHNMVLEKQENMSILSMEEDGDREYNYYELKSTIGENPGGLLNIWHRKDTGQVTSLLFFMKDEKEAQSLVEGIVREIYGSDAESVIDKLQKIWLRDTDKLQQVTVKQSGYKNELSIVEKGNIYYRLWLIKTEDEKKATRIEKDAFLGAVNKQLGGNALEYEQDKENQVATGGDRNATYKLRDPNSQATVTLKIDYDFKTSWIGSIELKYGTDPQKMRTLYKSIITAATPEADSDAILEQLYAVQDYPQKCVVIDGVTYTIHDDVHWGQRFLIDF